MEVVWEVEMRVMEEMELMEEVERVQLIKIKSESRARMKLLKNTPRKR